VTRSVYTAADLSALREIEDVLADYCFAVDEGSARGVVALFADTAELDVGNGVVIKGLHALQEFFQRRLAQYSASSHHLSNVRVQLEGGRAVARCYVYSRIWPVGSNGAGELWGRYTDTLISTPQGWRIERRQIRAAGWHGFPVFADQPDLFEQMKRHVDDGSPAES
jgi:ketosteroid isomerase-like protein